MPRCAFAPFSRRRRNDGGKVLRLDARPRDLVTNVALNVGQPDRIFLAAEADRIAIGARPGSAADPVHVVFAVIRQVIVKDVADIGYVQAARGDIRCNQYRDVAIMKIAHHFQALCLRHIARQGLRHEAVCGQRSLQQFRDSPGIDEYHGAPRIDAPQQSDQQRHFLLTGGEIQHLPHQIDRHLVRLNPDQDRVVHVLVGQLQDPIGQRRRKHHV